MIGPAVLVAGAESCAPAGAAEVGGGMKPVAMSQRPRRMKTVATSARTSRMTREYPGADAATNALSSAGRRQRRRLARRCRLGVGLAPGAGETFCGILDLATASPSVGGHGGQVAVSRIGGLSDDLGIREIFGRSLIHASHWNFEAPKVGRTNGTHSSKRIFTRPREGSLLASVPASGTAMSRVTVGKHSRNSSRV